MSKLDPQEYTVEEAALVSEAYSSSYLLCTDVKYIDFAAIILLGVRALVTESGAKDELFAGALKKMIGKLIGGTGELIFFVDKELNRLVAEVSPHIVLEDSMRYYWSFDFVRSLVPVDQQIAILESGFALANSSFAGATDAAKAKIQEFQADFPQEENLVALPIAVVGEAPLGFLMTEPAPVWRAAIDEALAFVADKGDRGARRSEGAMPGIRLM